jgi:hypothetical protein
MLHPLGSQWLIRGFKVRLLTFCITICYNYNIFDRNGRVTLSLLTNGGVVLDQERQYVKLRIADRFPEICAFSTTGLIGCVLWENGG